MFCDVTICDRLMPVAVKAMHKANTHTILPREFAQLNVLGWVGIWFKVTGNRCVIRGSTDNRIIFF